MLMIGFCEINEVLKFKIDVRVRLPLVSWLY